MAKESKVWVCSHCSKEILRWMGKCPSCGKFGTLEETIKNSNTDTSRVGLKSSVAIKPTNKALSISELNKKPITRTPTNINELDRVLGGGFVDGQVVLFAGFPGAGKSSLSLTIANQYARMGKKVLYSSGEESEQQIGLRAQRFNITNDNILIVSESSLETLLGHIDKESPDFIIVDSLQTLASNSIPGSIGSIQQSKESAHALTRLAKDRSITMLLISQVSKDGDFSGSEAIQHIVDTTILLESSTDTPLKFLRASKNRFGDTNEVGVFQHVDDGIEGVSDPSGIFIENNENAVGASCSFISEGIRQIPVEVQALVNRSTLPQPRKQFNGVNYNRAQIVCAILDKYCNSKLYENDVFVSTVSGIKVVDPQADLSIAASLLSSLKNKTIKTEYVFIGELSLTGQVRGTFMVDNKLREAERLGFTKAVVPYNSYKQSKFKSSKLEVIPVKTIKDLIPIIT